MQAILSKQHFFFVGVAGAGMSAIAQYLSGIGKTVSGSDRLFASPDNKLVQQQLETEGIRCYLQDGSGITSATEVVIVSTAIEETNIEIAAANKWNIPIVLRADLLAAICASKRTIAIAGTSGKSTTAAMLFHMLWKNNMAPSLITGAGLVSLQKQGKIGNAYCGSGDWLIIEADESDGTLVKYKPEIGVLLSIDKDHKELHELQDIFKTFEQHCQHYFITNQSHPLAKTFSRDQNLDFGIGTPQEGHNFKQDGFSISFDITYHNELIPVQVPTIGQHNMENALACLAAARLTGLSLADAAPSLASYEGIYRRHQKLIEHKGIILIDDYAHNPAKIAASIRACIPVGSRLIAWFQPHGYGPTRFIRKELVEEITASLRPQDQMWMSEIYYAGGTAVKDISAEDLVHDLKANQVNANFRANREHFLRDLIPDLKPGDVVLLMGARDPGLEKFAEQVAAAISRI
jgi:UDP-N-acetylmuramate--alanine ligase